MAGYATSMKSDLGTEISSGPPFGIVLPSHVSNSCIDNSSHPNSSLDVILAPNANVLEIFVSVNDGVFETPADSDIKYNIYSIRGINLQP